LCKVTSLCYVEGKYVGFEVFTAVLLGCNEAWTDRKPPTFWRNVLLLLFLSVCLYRLISKFGLVYRLILSGYSLGLNFDCENRGSTFL
jgi:hypothetical protein